MSLRLTSLALVATATLLTGCADDQPDAGPDAAATEVPPEGDRPIPVEGDGGIGGEGGGPVTSNLILSAEQVEVAGTCLVSESPPTYRLDLAPDGALTVVTGDQGGELELEVGGTTYASPEAEPPAVTASEGALSVQGRAVSDAGDEHFVDVVIGLDDLPAC